MLRHGDQGLLWSVVLAMYDTRKTVRIEPFTIALSQPLRTEEADEMTGCKSPERWRLQPKQRLMQ